MVQKVQAELRNLKTEQIHFLQWLYRTEPIEDEKRIAGLDEYGAAIEDVFQKLIKEGLVGAVGSFPYSVPFGLQAVEKVKAVTGWITYFNLLEDEYIQSLPENAWLFGIRPLAAGKIYDAFNKLKEDEFQKIIPSSSLSKKESIAQFCLAYCLMEEKVKTNIVSINSLEQGRSIIQLLKNIEPVKKEQINNAKHFLKQYIA